MALTAIYLAIGLADGDRIMIRIIPSAITFTANFIGGLQFFILTGHSPFTHSVLIAIVLSYVSTILDVFDGMTARLLKVESNFGRKLDTFYDFFLFSGDRIVTSNLFKKSYYFFLIGDLYKYRNLKPKRKKRILVDLLGFLL